MTLLIVIIISQVSSVSSWAQLFWRTTIKSNGRTSQMKLRFLVRGENRYRRLKTSWNKVEKHSTTIWHQAQNWTWGTLVPTEHGMLLLSSQWQPSMKSTKEHVSWQGPVQENVLYTWCWWCKCFRVYVGWYFFCFCRSLRSNRISKIEKNAFNYSRNLIYLWVK